RVDTAGDVVAGGLAEPLLVAEEVEHVVEHLEAHAEGLPVGAEGLGRALVEAGAVGAEPAGAGEQGGGLAPHRRQVGVDGATGVVLVLHLEHLALAQLAERDGDQPGGLLADAGGQLGGSGEDVVAGEHGVVHALDGVDGGAAAPGGGVVEDVVVDERADLHELDRGGRVDDPVVEHVAGGGGDDGEQRAQALAAGRHDPLGGGAERRPVAPDGLGQPLLDGGEPVGEVGQAEVARQPGGGEVGGAAGDGQGEAGGGRGGGGGQGGSAWRGGGRRGASDLA